MQASTSPLRPSTTFLSASRAAKSPLHGGQGEALDTAQPILSLPFDAMRQHYAGSVIAGLVPRSMLASARLERWLGTLEALTLGPLARCR